MKKLVLLLLILVAAIFSKPVERLETQKIASNWYNQIFSDKDIDSFLTMGDDNQLHIYTFENGGFVILSTDDNLYPILGYSENSTFNQNLDIPSIKSWFSGYIEQVDLERENSSSSTKNNSLWNNLLNNDFSDFDLEKSSVEPLIETKWNQNPIYNMYCPVINGQNAVVGCVATAMAQVIKYWEFPRHGYGQKTYTDYPGCGQTLSANFGETIYDYSQMPIRITGGSSAIEKHEVAQLSYHLGVSVSMMYGLGSTGGSGAYSHNVPLAMENYFNYSTTTSFKQKDNYSNAQWVNMLKTELDAGRPMYYSGYGDGGGHAFVCDGYQPTDHFHFNWGWNGQNDGFFYLDNLTPGSGGAGGGGYSFSNGQGAIFDCYPNEIDLDMISSIPDQLLEESSLELELSDYFVSNNGNSIEYSVEIISEDPTVSAIVSGSTLTINKIGDGETELRIKGVTSEDFNFDIIKVLARDYSPIAGNGYMINMVDGGYIEHTGDFVNGIEKLSFNLALNKSGEESYGLLSKSNTTMGGTYVTISPYGFVKFMVETEDGLKRKVVSETPLDPNKWYNLTGVFTGKDIKLFIDGKLDNVENYDSYSAVKDSDIPVKVGRVATKQFEGMIDNFYLYDRALQQDEIIQLMKNCSGENYLLGTNFDQGYGTTLNNSPDNSSMVINGLTNGCYLPSTAPQVYLLEGDDNFDSSVDFLNYSNYSLGNSVENGSLTLNSDGSFQYNPESGFMGEDSFNYQVEVNSTTSKVCDVKLLVGDYVGIDENLVENIDLLSAYPNPFNPTTTISFNLTKSSDITLNIYNSLGEIVSNNFYSNMKSGAHKVGFDGKNLSSGVYFITLVAGDDIRSMKIMLLK